MKAVCILILLLSVSSYSQDSLTIVGTVSDMDGQLPNQLNACLASRPAAWQKINYTPANGSFVITIYDADTQVDNRFNLPAGFRLSPPANNPGGNGGPGPTLKLDLSSTSLLTIKIYNIMGQLVTHLGEFSLQAGGYGISWDGRRATGAPLNAGIYFIRVSGRTITGAPFQITRKYMLLGGGVSGPSTVQPIVTTGLGKSAVFPAVDTLILKSSGRFDHKTEINFADDKLSLGHIQLDRMAKWSEKCGAEHFGKVGEYTPIWLGNVDNDNDGHSLNVLTDLVTSDNAAADTLFVYSDIEGWCTVRLELEELGKVVDSCSTRVLFAGVGIGKNRLYPDKSEGSPGDVINLKFSLQEGRPPFRITPEYNNDSNPEATFTSDVRNFSVPFNYDESNIYVPYIDVVDADGKTFKIFSESPIGIMPDLEQKAGVGLKIGTPESPEGDYLKGMQIFVLDQELFKTQAGTDYIKGELKRLKDNGVNLVMYNPLFFQDEITSNVNYPIYGEAWPAYFQNTLTIENLIKLSDWTHELGIMVAIRYFLGKCGNYDGKERGEFNPSDPEMYQKNQKAIKVYLAKIAQELGVEMFGMDAENPAFSLDERSIEQIQAVRAVFDGIIFDSPTTPQDMIYRSPLIKYLDLVYISDCLDCGQLEDKEFFINELLKIQQTKYRYEQLPFFSYHKKLGYIEIFAGNYTNRPNFQKNAYSALFKFMINNPDYQSGLNFWDWTIRMNEDPNAFTYSPKDKPAEDTLHYYFKNVLPDRMVWDFDPEDPVVAKMIDDFEKNDLDDIIKWTGDPSTIDIELSNEGYKSNKSLKINFRLDGDRSNVLIHKILDNQDWSQYSTLNIAIKSDGNGFLSLQPDIEDKNQERWSIYNTGLSYTQGWILMSYNLNDFQLNDWTQDNGILDIANINSVRFVIADCYHAFNYNYKPSRDEVFVPRELQIDQIFLAK
jgi:hypothetical protein